MRQLLPDQRSQDSQAAMILKQGIWRTSWNAPSLISHRVTFLTDYQSTTYAEDYRTFVDEVRRAEEKAVPGQSALAGAVARYLFKLMAYKDEYEVARLYSGNAFRDMLAEAFEGDYKVEFNLAPPLIAKRDPETGHLKKRSFGRGMRTLFKVLSKARKLRGTPFDPFGYTAERRQERELIKDYRETIRDVLSHLTAHNHDLAVQIASLPDHIRGYGHVKERNIQHVKERERKLVSVFKAPS